MADQFLLPRGVIVTVVDAATVADATKSKDFVVHVNPASSRTLVHFQFSGAATTFEATLSASDDGGVTFKSIVVAHAFQTTPFKDVELLPGLIYRWTPTTVAGGAGTLKAAAG